MKRRKMKVLRMIEWLRCERVQWLSHSSEWDTMTGSSAVMVHSRRVGRNSDITAPCTYTHIGKTELYNFIYSKLPIIRKIGWYRMGTADNRSTANEHSLTITKMHKCIYIQHTYIRPTKLGTIWPSWSSKVKGSITLNESMLVIELKLAHNTFL